MDTKKIIIFNFCVFKVLQCIVNTIDYLTVLPAKSDGDVMFCLHSYLGLIINRSLVCESYLQERINTKMINRFTLAQVKCTN